MGHHQINNLYTDINSPYLYASVQRLYKGLKDRRNISKDDVKKYLQKQNSYTLHYPVIKNFKRNQYRVFNIDDLWEIDLCDMRHLKKANDNFTFILTVIDVFSKYAFAIPLKKKAAEDVTKAFSSILKMSNRKPQIVQSDNGKEFKNSLFKNFLKSKNIKQYFAYNPILKCAVIERFNRTLKHIMYKHFTHRNTKRYIDILPNLIKVYNNNYHSTIKMKPSEVTEDEVSKINDIYLKKYEKLITEVKDNQEIFKIGDMVRVAKPKINFDRGFDQRWTKEKFHIDLIIKKKPFPLYILRDFKGTPITGRFYAKQLQKVLNNKVLPPVQKIIKTRGLGKTLQYFLKFSDDTPNRWVDKQTIIEQYGISQGNK